MWRVGVEFPFGSEFLLYVAGLVRALFLASKKTVL